MSSKSVSRKKLKIVKLLDEETVKKYLPKVYELMQG